MTKEKLIRFPWTFLKPSTEFVTKVRCRSCFQIPPLFLIMDAIFEQNWIISFSVDGVLPNLFSVNVSVLYLCPPPFIDLPMDFLHQPPTLTSVLPMTPLSSAPFPTLLLAQSLRTPVEIVLFLMHHLFPFWLESLAEAMPTICSIFPRFLYFVFHSLALPGWFLTALLSIPENQFHYWACPWILLRVDLPLWQHFPPEQSAKFIFFYVPDAFLHPLTCFYTRLKSVWRSNTAVRYGWGFVLCFFFIDRIQLKTIQLVVYPSLNSYFRSLACSRAFVSITFFYRYYFAFCSSEFPLLSRSCVRAASYPFQVFIPPLWVICFNILFYSPNRKTVVYCSC